MVYSITTPLPYPTNKPSNEDTEAFQDEFPHVREYPNGHRIRISDPKPDKINLTIPLVDEVLTEKLAAQVPLEARCEVVSQMLCSGGANSSVVPSSVQSHFSKPYNRLFQLEIGLTGALLRCEFLGGKKHGSRLCLSFNPCNVGQEGHKAIATLLFGGKWSSAAPIFNQTTFSHRAKITRIDYAVDCTGIRPTELLMRHDTAKGLTQYSSQSGLETIYLRKVSVAEKHALVKAYDKIAEVEIKGGDLSVWPSKVTRIEVTRKGLQQKYLDDIFNLPDPFRKLRCGYAFSQGAKCWKRFQSFRCFRHEYDIAETAELMGISITRANDLEALVAKVPNPDLVRPKQTWQGWKAGCNSTGIQALLKCPKTVF